MWTILRRIVAPEAREMVRRLQLARATHPVRTPEIAEIGMRGR
jgi:DNA-binding TFAR19-related protein (PDSD5 family)